MRILLYNSERRTVQRSGIDFEALRYQDSVLLAPLRERLQKRKKARADVNPEVQDEAEDDRAHVRVNPADLSEIYVYDDDPENPKWLTIPAIDQEYTKGLSLWKHRVIRNYVLRQKKEVNIYELAAAKQHLQEIVDREYELTRKGRKKLARYKGVNARSHLKLVPTPSISPSPETEPKPTDRQENQVIAWEETKLMHQLLLELQLQMAGKINERERIIVLRYLRLLLTLFPSRLLSHKYLVGRDGVEIIICPSIRVGC